MKQNGSAKILGLETDKIVQFMGPESYIMDKGKYIHLSFKAIHMNHIICIILYRESIITFKAIK